MQTVLLMVIVAVVAQVAAFLLNGLEPVRDFPGKNWLFLRMTACLTLLSVAIAALTDEAVVGWVRVVCWVGVGAIAIALLYDGVNLAKAVRVADARRRDPAANGTATAVGYAPELRAKLLAEMNRQVEERLKSAYGEQTLVDLQMQPEPDAVEGGKRESNVFLVSQPKQYVENFKDDRMRLAQKKETILDTFYDPVILGQLLILGAPGSGKTTALLRLTKDLLVQADANGIEIPYIFELSAWRDDRQDIASWLMAQLAFEHGIKEEVSRQWIMNGQLLPLLDGLDELATERRQTCIEKINEFVTSQLGRKVVVCCRTKVYEASGKKLDALNGALRIQPLEMSQVQDYFERVNPEIWEALQDEGGLGELLKPPEKEEESALLKIPLFLQILAIAYQPEQRISSKSELLDAYIARRLSLKVRKENRRLARKKAIRITWAYRKIDKEPEIEATNHHLCWLACKLTNYNTPNVFLIEDMQPYWLSTTLSKYQYWFLVNLLSLISLGSPAFVLSSVHGSPASGMAGGFLIALFPVLIGSLIVDLNRILRVEVLRISLAFRSRKKIIREFLWTLPMLLVLAVLIGELIGDEMASKSSFLIGFSLAMFIWLLQSPVRYAKDNFKVRHTPNQGILASIKNFLLSFLGLYGAFCFVGILRNYLYEVPVFPNTIGNAGLIIVPISCFYAFGGLSVVQHGSLRLILYLNGYIPWNYAKFLKYTTERRLTQQIGGSFRFIHRELLDHFAAMYDSTRESTSSKSV